MGVVGAEQKPESEGETGSPEEKTPMLGSEKLRLGMEGMR